MDNRILVVNGHPDPSAQRYCAALCDAYVAGVQSRGWQADRLDIGRMSPSFSHNVPSSPDEPLLDAVEAADVIRNADRIAIVFPLWIGAAPYMLQQFFEMVSTNSAYPRTDIAAELIVTMDMPALLYRRQLGVHSKFGGTRNPFRLQGVHTTDATLIGGVSAISHQDRQRWISDVQSNAAKRVERARNYGRRSLFGWHVPSVLPAWLSQTASFRRAAA